MTAKEMIAEMCDRSDAGERGIGVYEPALTKATRVKGGLTRLTFVLQVKGDFTPDDVLDGVKAYLAVGTVEAMTKLIAESSQ